MTTFLPEDSALNEAIASAFADLADHKADSEEYQQAVDQLSKLYKLKNEQDKINLEFHQTEAKSTLEQQQQDHQYDLDQRPFFKRVDPNVALTVIGNLAIGLAVIKYEQTGVVSSKVWSFMKKF